MNGWVLAPGGIIKKNGAQRLCTVFFFVMADLLVRQF